MIAAAPGRTLRSRSSAESPLSDDTGGARSGDVGDMDLTYFWTTVAVAFVVGVLGLVGMVVRYWFVVVPRRALADEGGGRPGSQKETRRLRKPPSPPDSSLTSR